MKQEKLEIIKKQLIKFKDSPLYESRIKEGNFPVMGEGSAYSTIMFIGEAPGKNEAKHGKPFCGKAGEILSKHLKQIGIKREDVYITNIVKDRPPANRDPLPEEIALYAPFLNEEINIISPKIIIPLGRFSSHFILKKYNQEDKIRSISILQGTPIKVGEENNVIQILPLFHPASIIYDKKKEYFLEKGFSLLKTMIKEA